MDKYKYFASRNLCNREADFADTHYEVPPVVNENPASRKQG